MRGRFQWRTSLRIRASSDRLWAIVDELFLIPKYHAEVGKVDLLSGQSTTATGVRYRGRRSASPLMLSVMRLRKLDECSN